MISTNKIIPLALFTAFVVFCALPAHADRNRVVNPSEGVTSNALASSEGPSLTVTVHDPTNCLPDCASGDPEDTPDIVAAPIQPQKADVAGRGVGRTLCCGKNTSNERRGIQWRSLILQELFLVGVEHGFRLATEARHAVN